MATLDRLAMMYTISFSDTGADDTSLEIRITGRTEGAKRLRLR